MSRRIDGRSRALVAQAAGPIIATTTDPKEDARQERAKATFNSQELAAFINDGEDKLHRRCENQRSVPSQGLPW